MIATEQILLCIVNFPFFIVALNYDGAAANPLALPKIVSFFGLGFLILCARRKLWLTALARTS